MPVFEDEDDAKTDGRSCATIREDLKACIFETDCVRVHKKTPRECFNTNDPSVPELCFRLRQLMFDCKRSLLDNRARFRGRKGEIY